MWPDRVSNPGPLTYESGALPTALRGPALLKDLQWVMPLKNLAEHGIHCLNCLSVTYATETSYR